MIDKSDDVVLQQLIKDNLSKFIQQTYKDAETGKSMEHMWSFDYAYKLEGVRDWLFRQVKK